MHELHLKKNDNSDPLFNIYYQNITDVHITKLEKGLFDLKDKHALSISFDIFDDNSNRISQPVGDNSKQKTNYSLILKFKQKSR